MKDIYSRFGIALYLEDILIILLFKIVRIDLF